MGSVEQFLAMHFEPPEPDFVDGEINRASLAGLASCAIAGKCGGDLGPVG
jgi:hypothetical protein